MEQAKGQQTETLSRHINPDGSEGGFVSNLSSVAANAFVPFSSLVAAGATLGPGERLEEGIVLMKGGVRKPNHHKVVKFSARPLN